MKYLRKHITSLKKFTFQRCSLLEQYFFFNRYFPIYPINIDNGALKKKATKSRNKHFRADRRITCAIKVIPALGVTDQQIVANSIFLQIFYWQSTKMGVPKFFRYTSERYPCLNELVKQYQVRITPIFLLLSNVL